jgi:hypothetical protein
MQYMASRPIVNAKEVRDDGTIVEIVVWQLDAPVPPCSHPYKYRLYFGAHGVCRIRFDTNVAKAITGMLDRRRCPTRSPH